MKQQTTQLLLFLCLMMTPLHSQWEHQNPLSHGNNLLDIEMITDQTIVAVGMHGIIQKTVDGGNSWYIVNQKRDLELYSVEFINNNTGFAAGSFYTANFDYTAVILKTEDAGESWTMTDLDITDELISIDFPEDETIGYATSKKGLYQTVDGGKTWQKNMTLPAWYYQIRNVNITNNNIITLLRTSDYMISSDGGKTWAYIELDVMNYLYDISFIDEHTGYVCGRHFFTSSAIILKTEDGGINWDEIMSDSDCSSGYNCLTFINDSTGYAIGQQDDGPLIKTSDYGETWNTLNIEDIDWHSITALDFKEETGCAVGNAGKIMKTIDGGINWTAGNTDTFLMEWQMEDIHFFNENHGWITGARSIYETTDGGLNWQQRKYNGGKLAVIDSLNAYSLGLDLFKTTDGWETHTEINSFNGVISENCIEFTDKNNGFIGGADRPGATTNAIIAKTTDGGATWTSQLLEGGKIISIQFMDHDRGYAFSHKTAYADFKTHLFQTVDGGENWNLIYTIPEHASAMQFINNNTGYIVGHHILYKTEDGGLNWTSKQITSESENTFVSIKNLFFIDENYGYLCDKYGKILRTENGGLNWQEQESGTHQELNVIFMLNKEEIWSAGGNRTLLHTDNGGESSIEPLTAIPQTNHITGNYPNPFNPGTMISYTLPAAKWITIKVFNIRGEEVAKLFNDYQQPGTHSIPFNGSALPSGIYMCSLIIDKAHVSSKKMMLIK